MKPNKKNLLLDKLSVCYNRINYLEALCEEQGLTDEATQFGRRKDRLKLEMDGLLRDLYQEWIGDADALKKTLDESNKAIDKTVKDIEKNIKAAENIVKVIGYIDDVIETAARLLI